MEGKAEISNKTNAKVFDLLNKAGVKTAFVKLASDKAFIARACEMVPIEWVTRRLATGSYLKVIFDLFLNKSKYNYNLFREILAFKRASVSRLQSKNVSLRMMPMMIHNGVRSKS
jgi:phosphoribosylaminoimidazole-succinocarboxamide synthase